MIPMEEPSAVTAIRDLIDRVERQREIDTTTIQPR